LGAKKKYSLDAGSASQLQKRKQGRIGRRTRKWDQLSLAQRELAQALADRYGVELDKSATYLDWYAALSKGWITLPTAETETGQKLL
jgi:hypothetical protein